MSETTTGMSETTTGLIGTLINRYRLEEALGGSDIASVFRAYDTRLGRDVALKLVMHSQAYSEEFVETFMKEARALARLTHPNIARVLDFGQHQGFIYLVSEFVTGESLESKLVKGQPASWQAVVETLIPITEALEHAHQAGIIHRGLKPSNILIAQDGRPVITDFSITRILEAEETREMTGTHVGLGSPFYMSPEQGKGLNVDDRADIYALGTIFFEWVTGFKPFSSGSSMEIVIQQVSTPPPPPSQFVPDLPVAVERIIQTMLCKDRDERFQTMAEVTVALRRVLESGQFTRRGRRKNFSPARMAVWSAASLLAVAAVAFFGMRFAGVGPFAPPTPTVVAVLPAVVTATPRPSLTPPPPTVTPTQTSTTAPEQPTPEATATPVQTALAYQYPQLPVLEGSPLPSPAGSITRANASGLVELARWGSPMVRALAWSLDDRHIYAATSAGVYIYNAKDLSPVYFFDAFGSLTTLAVSDDNRLLATGDDEGMVRLWDPLTAALLKEMPGHSGPITALDFSSTGERLISASKDRTARLWNTSTGQEIAPLKRHGMTVTGAVFLKGDREAVTVSEDFKILRWNSDTGELTGQWTSQGQARLLDAYVGEKENQVAVVTSSPAVEIWDLAASKIIANFPENDLGTLSGTLLNSLAYSPNFTLIATSAGDGKVRIWNAGGQLNLEFAPIETPVDQKASSLIEVIFSHDATRLAALSQGGTMVVVNYADHTTLTQRDAAAQAPTRLSSSWNGEWILEGYSTTGIVRRQFDSGKSIQKVPGWLPSGVVGGPIDLTNVGYTAVRPSEVEGYEVLAVVSGSSATTILMGYNRGAVRFLPGEKIVASAAARAIYLWSMNSDLRLTATRYAYLSNCQVAYGIDGAFLAAGSDIGVFIDEKSLPFFCALRRVSYGLDWSYVDGGSKIAYGLSTGQVELWWSGENGQTVSKRYPVEGGAVRAVAISPDEKLLATGSADGLIRVWDAETMELVNTLGRHTEAINDLIFTVDGQYIISCASDGTLEVWGLFNK